MTISVSPISSEDRAACEVLCHGYAEFYQVPMNNRVFDTVWGRIHGALVGFLDVLFVSPEASGQEVVEQLCAAFQNQETPQASWLR